MNERKKKEKLKNAKATEVKEVKMSYKIEFHDYQVRMRAAMKFLQAGNRVKAGVNFKGREISHLQLGMDRLNTLAEDLSLVGLMEGKPKKEGVRSISVIISPRPEMLKAQRDAAKKKKADEEKAKKASDAVESAASISSEASCIKEV
jgi:translation initiation factor IF-3